MIAFDTCVLVRLLTDDAPLQTAQAITLLQEQDVLLLDTVLLETEWVLRSRYRKKPNELLDFFRLLLQAENVVLENPKQFQQALSWYELGADFADAMHLSACSDVELHTFDRGFCKKARQQKLAPEVKLLIDS